MKELKITVTVRNNRLLKAREAMGYSQVVLSKASGVSLDSVKALESFKVSPLKADGEWKSLAIKIADALEQDVSYLFSENIRRLNVKSVSREISVSDLQLIFDSSYPDTLAKTLKGGKSKERLALELLSGAENITDRDKSIVKKAFGVDGENQITKADIAREEGLSRERVGKIIEKALYKIKRSVRQEISKVEKKVLLESLRLTCESEG